MKFGDRIRLKREELELSRKALADKLQISYYSLAKYETSLREPDFKTLAELAELLNVSADYLLGIEEKKSQLALPNDERDLLKTYRLLPPEGKERIINQLHFEYSQHFSKGKDAAM